MSNAFLASADSIRVLADSLNALKLFALRFDLTETSLVPSNIDS